MLQSVNMGLGAFIVPLLIGIAEYGQYSAYFAIPASASVFVHSYLIATARTFGLSRFRHISIRIVALVGGLIFLGGLFYDGIYMALIVTMIFVFLIERLRREVVVLCFGADTGLTLDRLGRVEVRLFLTSVVAIGAFVYLNVMDGIWLPILLLAGSLVSAISVFNSIPLQASASSAGLGEAGQQSTLRSVFSRIHEELFITQMPLVLSRIEGSFALAGLFRLAVSAAKIVFKLYPYRFDVVIAARGSGLMALRQLRVFTAIIILLPPVVVILFWSMFGPLLARAGCCESLMDPIFLGVFSVSGMLAVASAFLPYFISRSWTWMAPVAALFVCSVTALWLWGAVAFICTYFLSNSIICLMLWRGVFSEKRKSW
jgi:hypothetical protein